MKKFALLSVGMLMAASTCFADAQIEIQGAASDYVQKYVMDNFHAQYPEYVFESRNEGRVIYSAKKPVLDKKKSNVIASTLKEVVFTTEQSGDNVILGIEQKETVSYRDGKQETKKSSDDLEDKVFLNQYRQFFNDTYSFCFTPAAKPSKEGVPILSVFGYGPMKEAGIKNGAVVLAVNGEKVTERIKEFQNNLLPDQFSGAPVKFTIKYKDEVKDYTLTPVVRESKYTKIKAAQAKAEQEKAEGKRGIESWLKL